MDAEGHPCNPTEDGVANVRVRSSQRVAASRIMAAETACEKRHVRQTLVSSSMRMHAAVPPAVAKAAAAAAIGLRHVTNDRRSMTRWAWSTVRCTSSDPTQERE